MLARFERLTAALRQKETISDVIGPPQSLHFLGDEPAAAGHSVGGQRAPRSERDRLFRKIVS
jgi:hypothetical protein